MRLERLSCPRKAVHLLALFLLLVAVSQAGAQTFTVLHTFHGAPNDGEAPLGTLVRDAAGNLYGVTEMGGSGICGQFSCGTAFMLSKTGKELGVFSFSGKDGTFPAAGLFRDSAGNLYGTTVRDLLAPVRIFHRQVKGLFVDALHVHSP